MNEPNRTEKFLDLYRQLEKVGRNTYFPESGNEPVVGRLIALPIIKEFKDDIEYCRTVRNFLVHTPKVGGMYPIVPSAEMVNIMQKCVDRLSSPLPAMKFAIRRENMYTASLSTPILDVARYMDSHGFTHVPIFDGRKLVGIFSDNTIYAHVCSGSGIAIDEGTPLSVLSQYLALDMHTNEYFAFIERKATLYEVSKLFTIDVRSMKNLAVVFFTDHGKVDEDIVGMMTPYSMLRDAPQYF